MEADPADGRSDERAGPRIGLAWSGDLAYSYGTTDLRGGRTAAGMTTFLRIWRKDASGSWKVCLDVELPIPSTPS